MERDPDASGTLIVKDGGVFGKVLGTFNVFNGSFPQSVYTQSTVMYVQFEYTIPKLPAGQKCKIFEPCIRFLLRVTSTSGDLFFVIRLFVYLFGCINTFMCVCGWFGSGCVLGYEQEGERVCFRKNLHCYLSFVFYKNIKHFQSENPP